MNNSQQTLRPYVVITFGIVAVSTSSVFIRYAHTLNVPSIVIAASRLFLAAIIITPVALTRYNAELKELSSRSLRLALLSGLFLAIHFATWITSLEYTTVASSVVIVSTSPLWVALVAPLTLKEPLTRLILLGLFLALIGGAIVGISDSCTSDSGLLICPSLSEFVTDRAFFGDLLALAGAMTGAGYLIIGRKLRVGMSLIPYVFLVYGMAAVVLSIFMFVGGETPLGYPAMAYVWIILLALIPQLLGHSTFNWALKYLSAAFVSLTLLGEPIGSSLLAYFLFHEQPTKVKLIGAILILSGLYIASRQEAQPV